MGKTYRGDDKDRLKEQYQQQREKRQKQRHVDEEFDKADVPRKRLPRDRYSDES